MENIKVKYFIIGNDYMKKYGIKIENIYEPCSTIGRNKEKRFYFNNDDVPDISKVEKLFDDIVKEESIKEVLED